MAIYRPAIKADDNYFEKLLKYIPIEIITAYMALMGILASKKVEVVAKPDCPDLGLYTFIFLLIVIVTPLYIYWAVRGNLYGPPNKPEKLAIFHTTVSVIAVVIWMYMGGHPPMICFFEHFLGSYDQRIGSILMVAFCLCVPLLENLILGKLTRRPDPK